MNSCSNYVLQTVTGESAPVLGEAMLTVDLDGCVYRHNFLVADIIDDCIMGLDFMEANNVIVNITRKVLQCRDVEFPLTLGGIDVPKIAVAIAQDCTIPGNCEMIVGAELVEGLEVPGIVIVEPERNIMEGILIARTTTELHKEKLIAMRIGNFSGSEKQLKKGYVIGHIEGLVSVRTMKTANIESKQQGNKMVPESLKSLVPNELSDDKKEDVIKLLNEFRDIFACTSGDFGRTNKVKHRINTGNDPPIRQVPRRLPLAKQTEVAEIIEAMHKEGVIEPSDSPWASPVVLVRKKDGTMRFCVDYRKLNDITKKDSYPLPRIDDTLDTLSGATWFSTLDLKSGYWQVEMEQGDKEKTAFTVGTGLWQFNVMPFGLCNAPATFERLMEHVLRGLAWNTCLVYLDDIIVIGKSFDEHLERLREVFQRLRGANLKLSPKKCELFKDRVKYLGHEVSTEGVATDVSKVVAVKKWPVPKDKTELRSFLGLCTYYRRFIKNFADIAGCLHKLTEKGRVYKWSSECDTSFQELKERLCSAPILAYPKPGERFIIDTDASNIGIGGVLSQIHNGEEKVIAYFSRKLSKQEVNYCVTRRELLAVVATVKNFHKYLYGQEFLLRTDHAALRWLLHFKNPEGQAARWIERLQGYDFQTEHRKGTVHLNADALSRRPCAEICKHCDRLEEREEPVIVRVTKISADDASVQTKQRDDQDISEIIQWIEKGQRPQWKDLAEFSTIIKSYWAQWHSLQLVDGTLYRNWEAADGKSSRLQLVLPQSEVPKVLDEIHGGASGGHLGINKTITKIRERFYWVNIRDDVENWCRKCDVCAACKGPRRRTRAEMKLYNVGAPFERIAIDVAGPFPKSRSGNKYVLVAMDYFSKWPEVYAIPNQEATTVAEALISNWISRFGVPLELHSDQGRNFESNVFQEMCQTLGIRKTRTTPLHPQSDGMVERFNRTLEGHLAKVVESDQEEWDRHIPIFLMAYRNAMHETTKRTPAEVMFGRNMRLPVDVLFGQRPHTPVDVTDFVANLRIRLNEVHQFARRNLKINSDRMKTRYDVTANSKGFQENDTVWLYNPQRKKGKSPKFMANWEGPYKIIKRINDVVYRIQRSSRAKMKVVHIDRLSPYQGLSGERS